MEHNYYKIGVITNSNGQSMSDLTAVADTYGVVFEQITFSNISLSSFRESELVQKIGSYDLIYYRTGMKGAVVQELVDILDAKGIPHVNCVAKHPNLHLKIRQALIASRYKIDQPKSYYITGFEYDKVAEVLGPTFVVKPDDSSKGKEVTLITSDEEMRAFKATKSKERYIYQEHIEDADEYRVYTIGSKGVATYKKIRSETDFRANLHAGGSVTQTEPERVQKLLEFGGHIAECFGADISGVDILMKDDKMLFLELNWQPGWEQLDTLTGTDFSKATIQYLLRKAHNHHKPWWNFLGVKY